MELRVTSPAGAKLPICEPFALTPGIPPVKELFDQNFVQPVDYQLGSDYAPIERLLQADLLGRIAHRSFWISRRPRHVSPP
jgi:hypothetical protein